jgi:hypothetical protein
MDRLLATDPDKRYAIGERSTYLPDVGFPETAPPGTTETPMAAGEGSKRGPAGSEGLEVARTSQGTRAPEKEK